VREKLMSIGMEKIEKVKNSQEVLFFPSLSAFLPKKLED